MSEADSKLCKICLNSNTDTGLSTNPSLNKFFSQILGIHEPPSSLWLCVWCKSVLKKTMRLIQTAKKSQRMLSQVNSFHKNFYKEKEIKNVFTLTLKHNEHFDIPPDKEKHKLKIRKTKDKEKNKTQKLKTKEIQFVNLNEKEIEIKVKDESDIEMDEIKEEYDVDVAIDDNDANEEIDTHEATKADCKLDDSRSKITAKLYDKCEEINFTFQVLSFDEQMEDMEAKKRCEKYLSRKFKCELCATGFLTKEVLEDHKKKHQESYSPHACQICHLRFTTAPVLSQHVLAHERRFTCKLCGTITTRFCDCQNHRLKCGRPTPGVCPHCKKIFSNQISLDQHIRGVHYSKEKKYVCSFCDQRFQSKPRLDVHVRTHTGAKPYACELCPRVFAANSNLRYHQAAHGQARPHYCVECDKSYKTRKGLRRHLLEGATHKGRTFSCQYCLKNFGTEKLLESHIAVSHVKETGPCVPRNKESTLQDSSDLKKHAPSECTSPQK